MNKNKIKSVKNNLVDTSSESDAERQQFESVSRQLMQDINDVKEYRSSLVQLSASHEMIHNLKKLEQIAVSKRNQLKSATEAETKVNSQFSRYHRALTTTASS